MKIVIAVIVAMLVTSICLAISEFTMPVDVEYFMRATSNFGDQGDDYLPGFWHCGLDIPCPEGMTVKSAAGGTIIVCSPSGWDLDTSGQNYAMCIRHKNASDELSTWVYGHLKRPPEAMSDDQVRHYRIGDIVHAGEKIGTIGHYGTMPHLHLAIYCNLQNPGEFPAQGYGKQPLPRPAAETYKRVLHYGNWYDPNGWIKMFQPADTSDLVIAYNCHSAVASEDQQSIFYIREEPGRRLLMLMNLDGSAATSIWVVPTAYQVASIFAGPDNSVFLKLSSDTQYAFFWVKPGNAKLLFSSNKDFWIGSAKKEINYLPVRTADKWQAFDYQEHMFKDRQGVMNTAGSLSWLVPAKNWRLIGTENGRLSCWVVSPTNELHNWLTSSGVEYSGIQTSNDLPEPRDPTTSEPVVFSKKVNGRFVLMSGTIIPIKGDANANGYSLKEDKQLLSTQYDEIVNSTINTGGTQQLLLTLRHGDKSGIFVCGIDGSGLRQLAGPPLD